MSPTKTQNLGFIGTKCKAIDYEWDDLSVTATIQRKVVENGKKITQKTDKVILNHISGSIKHGKFTAIMGPSGKTRLKKLLTIFRLRKNNST